MTVILGVKLENRIEQAQEFQSVLTEFGCDITTRLGLHGADDRCENYGIILLEVKDVAKAQEIENTLLEIEGVTVQKMLF